MELILDSDQLTSAEFTAPRQFGFMLGDYQGGTWAAEMQTPAGEWVVVNGEDYDRAGAWVAPGFPGVKLRFTGGMMGARIWAVGVFL